MAQENLNNERQIIESFQASILKSLGGVMKTLEGLDEQQLNWKPPAPETNSLYSIASHVLINSQENLLTLLCGVPAAELPLKPIPREQALGAQGETAARLIEQWQILQPALVEHLAALPGEALFKEYQHPRRGPISGVTILVTVTGHMAEHLGHAELTRDLVKALK
ncbi:MAG: DinB family protein [Chloroflexi bacterium]|nr:DinB family protein [Chloroflexota bacterium]OJW02787.1 MAG: hypothetical protein BGO39_06060 [Chloroflexi bacterium 54-19]